VAISTGSACGWARPRRTFFEPEPPPPNEVLSCPDGALFRLSAADVRAFFTANAASLAKRPNVVEELGLLRHRVALHLWVYCCQHLLRRLTARSRSPRRRR
jgi:hypothetical protein